MVHCTDSTHVHAEYSTHGLRCVTCLQIAQRRWYLENQERIAEFNRQHKSEIKDYNRRRNQEIKRQVFEAYGGCFCVCCKEANFAFLTIDHIEGKGNIQRQQLGDQGRGMNFYRWLIKNDFPEGYQVLCFNCNCGRSVNGGICPHVAEKDNTIGHSFEQSGPGDAIINMTRPDGHAHLDQKYDKGMRSPWLGTIGNQDAGLVSPETSAQNGSGHMDSGYSGVGGTGT